MRQIGKTVTTSVRRPGDFGARYGGEEFILILPNTDREGAEQVGETLRKRIGSLKIIHEKSDVSSYVTVSIGITTCIPHNDITMEDAINTADEALYAAKGSGRNKIYYLEKNCE